ncbi:N-acetylmuramoyl-L-alanine amidase [Jeotgalibacillus campisalis]|uniref:CwlC n=1 Tax=Jeotgalibacillus campisalis TaxID=220754 RepID=A0A0C2V1I9_9BACL|nr:N-acetylmuramoyl-L-alanine amidase [Jeotgalibacillus campisalis]KIL42937.1 cwlC [Jeotgalibacillus campisalis]
MTLIAIDAGHGYETPGKRSPDGMKEYDFNRAVAKECILQLEKASIKTLQTYSDSRDVPLSERTSKANKGKADYFISIHANAYGNGEWNAVQGIETFIHPKKGQTANSLASKIHSDLIAKTGRKDRGLKMADFHVLRESNMPALLLECGFMTNREEKALLASTAYRTLCGKQIAASILSFLKKPATVAKEQSTLYRVQAGVYSSRERAEQQVKKLKGAGFEAAIGPIPSP